MQARKAVTMSQGSNKALFGSLVIVGMFMALLVGIGGTLAVTQLLGGSGPEGPGAGGGEGEGGPGGGGGAPPALVRIGEIKTQKLMERAEVVGRLEPVRTAIVAGEVSGRVLEVPTDEGDAVEANTTVLARIDDVWARLDLDAAKAEVASAEATLDQSRRDLAQLEQLLGAKSAKPKEVQDARAKVKSDQAELDRLIAERDRKAELVERITIVAPFDGVVVDKLTERGQWIAPGSAVAKLISRGEIDAVMDVPERLILQLAVGDQVPVIVEAIGLELTGKVVAINPLGLNSARTFPVKVRLDDRNGSLKPGMSVLARMPVGGEKTYTTVPRDAVQFAPSGAQVWTMSPAEGEGLPQAVPVGVKVLFGQGGRFAIKPVGSGPPLADGASVVTEGAESLFPMRGLTVQNDQSSPSSDQPTLPSAEQDTEPPQPPAS